MGTPGGKTKAGDWQARKITFNMFLSFPFLCHKSLLTKLSRARDWKTWKLFAFCALVPPTRLRIWWSIVRYVSLPHVEVESNCYMVLWGSKWTRIVLSWWPRSDDGWTEMANVQWRPHLSSNIMTPYSRSIGGRDIGARCRGFPWISPHAALSPTKCEANSAITSAAITGGCMLYAYDILWSVLVQCRARLPRSMSMPCTFYSVVFSLPTNHQRNQNFSVYRHSYIVCHRVATQDYMHWCQAISAASPAGWTSRWGCISELTWWLVWCPSFLKHSRSLKWSNTF